jgi:hypothetical protein
MERTNKEWYNLLSPSDKVKFNHNCANVSLFLAEKKKHSRWSFMSDAFKWVNTPEGHEYWSKIANQKDEL